MAAIVSSRIKRTFAIIKLQIEVTDQKVSKSVDLQYLRNQSAWSQITVIITELPQTESLQMQGFVEFDQTMAFTGSRKHSVEVIAAVTNQTCLHPFP